MNNFEEQETDVVELDKSVLIDDKAELADNIIKKYTAGSMSIGLVPLPLVDLTVLVALQLRMLHKLSGLYGIEFNRKIGATAIRHLASSITPVSMVAPVFFSLSKFIPLIGPALSSSGLIVLNGAATYGIGKVFEKHFFEGGSLQDFEAEQMRHYFTEQYVRGKDMVTDLIKVSKN